MHAIVRPPAVSGQFYPADPARLARDIDGFLAAAIAADPAVSTAPLGIMVPHAGYVYSGAVAARAWARVREFQPDTVVLIGPDHFVGFAHVAIYARGAFGTPLGRVAIDEELALALVSGGRPLVERPEAHEREHSLEVHVPFVRRLFPSARIVPILMGRRSAANIEALAEALARNLPGRQALLVASSDLSHYHDRQAAARLDQVVVRHVGEMDPAGLRQDLDAGVCEACGGDALVATLEACLRLGADRATVIGYADSGAVNGDTDSVVGYLAAAIEKTGIPSAVVTETGADEITIETPPEGGQASLESPGVSPESQGVSPESPGVALSADEIARLLSLAREAVAHAARGTEFESSPDDWPDSLKTPGGAFVTVKRGGELRGCVGFNRPLFPLGETVIHAARSAVLDDGRFEPVEAHEIGTLTVEISILGPSRPATPEEIVVGRHGIFVSRDSRRGLLLPQVAVEHGWTPLRFLSETCRKAGLPPDAWKEGAAIEIFEAFICSGPA